MLGYIDGHSYQLINVKVKFVDNFVDNGLKNDTMVFVVLDNQHSLYRLFGFYNSDILGLKLFAGIEEVDSFIDLMVKENVLSKKNGRLYYRCIKGEKRELPFKINRPCQFLNLYFPDNNQESRSILLKKKPLTELYF